MLTQVFPHLDELCRKKGTYFAPVDLRWGISEHQAKSGQVIRLCLDYIRHSAPFFIGLLGERYGQHRPPSAPPLPDSLDKLSEDAHWLDKSYLVAAAAGHDWVLEDRNPNLSVTELEITAAAFRSRYEHCYFYVRVTEDEDKVKISNSQEKFARLELNSLKWRIQSDGHFPVKYFSNVVELADMIVEDWTQVIEQLYPETDKNQSDSGKRFSCITLF